MTTIYINDEGTNIDLETTITLSGASSVEIEAQKPSGDTVTWTGSVQDTTEVRYTTQSGDIDEVGIWRLQAKVNDLSGFTGLGETVTLEVLPAFK